MKSREEFKKIAGLKVPELIKLEKDKRKELTLLIMSTKFGRNSNTSSIRQLKKTIAQIKTLINQAVVNSSLKEENHA